MWSIMRTVFNLVYRENLLASRCFYICTEYYKYICNPLVIYYYYNIKKEVEQCGACQYLTGFEMLHIVFRSGA